MVDYNSSFKGDATRTRAATELLLLGIRIILKKRHGHTARSRDSPTLLRTIRDQGPITRQGRGTSEYSPLDSVAEFHAATSRRAGE